MNSEYYQRAAQRHQQELARLQSGKSREVKKVADENKKVRAAAEAATRTSSLSTAQSKLREAQRYEDNAARYQQKVAELEGKIAQEQVRLNDAQKRADAAREQEHRKRMQEQERSAREHERKIKSITGKLDQHAQLHRVAMTAIQKLQQLPEQITVLLLAANPQDQPQLRLDEEVREINEMIRKSAHRDAVRLESRWAVRPLDVLQAINEAQPRIVHFSGHGSEADEIMFVDNAGNAKPVRKEAIVETMAATSEDIQLIFFNTCYSRGQAQEVVQHVPAAIGMNTAIGDDAARVFAAQFYSALGFGHSVGRAFKQAKAALMLEDLPEEATPELFVTEGLSADDLVLVKPGKV